MNIYLVGFMGSGKTTVSKVLAKRLNWDLVDTDNYIVDKYGREIKDIFATEGEQAFRDMETAVLEELSVTENKVISCGGGIVLRKQNVDLMRLGGKIVLLNASPETIYDRVKHSTGRPILNGNMNVEYIAELMSKRSEAYEYAADVVIDTDGKDIGEIAGEIIEKSKGDRH